MLISFSVANFRSIGAEQTLNLVASNKISDHHDHLVPITGTEKNVVRTAIIYGANAAGKSNLVRAMAAAQALVNGEERRIYSVEPFRFSADFAGLPTSFEFRFLVDNRIFIYGFDVKVPNIEAEWLSVLHNAEERVVFERDKGGKTTRSNDLHELFPNDQDVARILDALASLPLTPGQLFLNRANSIPGESQGEILRAVIQWLTKDLLILLPDHRSPVVLNLLSNDDDFRQLAESFLYSVGTGVGQLKFLIEDVPEEHLIRTISGRVRLRSGFRDDLEYIQPKPDEPDRFISKKLVAMHPVGESSATLPFIEESDGTRQLLHLMPVLASPLKGTKVVVIDELDRSLHPLICWEFIRLFSETTPGAHKQLIVTTHEAHMLNQDLLRRDEYWFVEKDSHQQTQIASLSEYNVRKDLKIEKGYLQGRFGGIPIIGSMAEIERLLNGLQ